NPLPLPTAQQGARPVPFENAAPWAAEAGRVGEGPQSVRENPQPRPATPFLVRWGGPSSVLDVVGSNSFSAAGSSTSTTGNPHVDGIPGPVPRSPRVTHPTPSRKSYEVVIVGGGIAGVALTYFLAERGLTDVLLLEREPQPGYHATGR